MRSSSFDPARANMSSSAPAAASKRTRKSTAGSSHGATSSPTPSGPNANPAASSFSHAATAATTAYVMPADLPLPPTLMIDPPSEPDPDFVPPFLEPGARQLSTPNNRGRKLLIQSQPAPSTPQFPQWSAPKSDVAAMMGLGPRPDIRAPLSGDPFAKKTQFRLPQSDNYYAAYAEPASIKKRQREDSIEDDANVADLLQPATSLDDFMSRPEMCDLHNAKQYPKLTMSVMDVVKNEQVLHNSLARFLRALQAEVSGPLDQNAPERKARDAAVELLGSTGEVIAQFQDVSVGLAHTAHQQQYLWKVIRDKAGPQRDHHG
ncbi:hypothetical protein BCR44DRAFT_76722 [Catenaria anguillulae PL171]|uniref:Transcriptional regulatory protein RXT2 N-terminal domain-containing protein n=1 Tax=Catenaria anguillulae PL171 TaxID=765915 RepID=A0A1Y2I489_9FUNG|nr:hypothetical protein BCR44DRAFT_76722 [Catenaria anguillulae PL171]